jgi:hypothetical protein
MPANSRHVGAWTQLLRLRALIVIFSPDKRIGERCVGCCQKGAPEPEVQRRHLQGHVLQACKQRQAEKVGHETTAGSERCSGGDATMRAGLTFIRLAGGVENAQEQLSSLKALIETAQALE